MQRRTDIGAKLGIMNSVRNTVVMTPHPSLLAG